MKQSPDRQNPDSRDFLRDRKSIRSLKSLPLIASFSWRGNLYTLLFYKM
ncbi:hypothetical protein [Sporosarcina ureae]|nr:hypothetical protein [Sporosarcina ureae]